MHSIQRPAAACPDPSYTALPDALHALVETPREYQLVALLLSYRWYSTSPIIPSVKTLADRLKCSARTVRRTVANLEDRGLIRREERRAEDRRQMSNDYVLCGALLSAVTAIEAMRDREARPVWPGGRSPMASKAKQRNPTNRNSQTKGLQPGVRTSGFLESREGHYRDVIRR